MLGQQACAAKSNEITAIRLLLERLALAGALVTIDAMECQTKIAQAILDRGGDYLLGVKYNQPSLHDEIRRYLDDPAATLHSRFETTDGDHERIAVRRHAVSHDVDWLTTARRFPGEPHRAMNLFAQTPKNKASRPDGNPPLGIPNISKLCSVNQHDPFKRFPCSASQHVQQQEE